ncbi:hypothetical protein GNI_040060 [Gregarina niphandrodes]|uniref:ER membrane protein complex subunit 7 beta-sandwich domain-containing protein n=1 Tax=Gregarina niphandrodes TaxID=110365 RepID=A0A023BAB9_GRENI|nr:hypothetical protein GNI_040060 [Gregarina niphandrodes]EZG78206.1 hypothetical protein GNI_040060 [Gregarina niphandrodes]|eukprot:XP_011129426.1 hypothetical protein GNI_040060 [Gregarina niphandrodes]
MRLFSAAILALTPSAKTLTGKIVIPRLVTNEEGAVGKSWWYTEEKNPFGADWKRRNLNLTKTVIEVIPIGQSEPSARIQPDSDGSFITPDVKSDVLIRASHPAFIFESALISVDDINPSSDEQDISNDGVISDGVEGDRLHIFRVEPHEGVKRKLKRSGELVLPATKILSPYSNPKAFSVWSLVKNPIVLLGGGMLFISYGLPALTKGMDLDKLREEAGIASTGPSPFTGSFIPLIKHNHKD